MAPEKLVSVGVPVYNEGSHVRECLESIARDSYPNKEIVIADNGSTDNTWDVIQEFKAKYDGSHEIRVTRHDENKGAIYNFSHVLERSRGEYFVWAGAHDAWGDDFLKECVAVLEREPRAVLVMPMVKWIDERSNVLELGHCVIDTRSMSSPAERVLRLMNQWKECTAIYGVHRKAALLNALPWSGTLAADNIALVKIAKQGDIVPTVSTRYLRRARAPEVRGEQIRRHLASMKVTGMARSRPRTMYTLRLLSEVASAKGPFRARRRLVSQALRTLPAVILAEFFPIIHRGLKRLGQSP